MSALNDFAALMNDIQLHQQELGTLFEKITQPDEKEMMGKLMSEIESARQQAAEIVPVTLQQIQDSAQSTAAQAKEQMADVEQRKKQLQVKRDAAAAAAPPIPKPKQEVRVDPKLGPTLRLELLHRFGEQADGPSQPSTIKEAWEDWQ